MLRTRIISAVIGIPLLLLPLFFGGIYWKALFLGMGIIALHEYFSMVKNKGVKPLIVPGYFLLLVLLFRQELAGNLSLMIIIALFSMVIMMVYQYPKILISDLAFSLLGAIYIGYLLGFANMLADFPGAFYYILLGLLLTWSTDVGGYFFGKQWGKRKLVGQLSPNKTWAGALGGLILTIITTYVFNYFHAIETTSVAYLLILGLLASIAAQFGDLFISGIKRYCGAKDSGYIIPGHGGVLDRFDSFLLVLPVLYFFLSFMIW